jgi:hypothetical protein
VVAGQVAIWGGTVLGSHVIQHPSMQQNWGQ